ncbi:MAG: homocysteine S-methyltransferase family protein [Deltaproteobacteria bacterium]|nr:homocysteine S-methyltransferase family protein [Deltaproteobacteria bacterium]MBW2130391.1 homocysteine S-methyltransferase family protein [Deltaproteobacteria bacterium]MBW2304483.1 homocysteine S-methyltransferase family protein [Deltaproteobacteria bacterium]
MGKDLLILSRERVVVFDGAMGTMLMAAGLPPGLNPEMWNLERPEAVLDVHRKYYEAGSDVVHTNTFGANPLKLADRGLSEQTGILNREGARIAREACPRGKFVAGDMGPTGKMPEPLGDVPLEKMEEGFLKQAEALLEGGVDFISIETMYSLEEALAALRGARRAGCDVVSVSMTFNRTKRGFFTVMGESPARCREALEKEGVDIIASNCTLGTGDMIDLTAELAGTGERPLLIQPNAGKPVSRRGVITYEQNPSEFAEDCKDILEAGATMIGGCCGTGPHFIRELVRVLSSDRR